MSECVATSWVFTDRCHFFRYYFAILKLYALFTLHVTAWGTREGVAGGVKQERPDMITEEVIQEQRVQVLYLLLLNMSACLTSCIFLKPWQSSTTSPQGCISNKCMYLLGTYRRKCAVDERVLGGADEEKEKDIREDVPAWKHCSHAPHPYPARGR